jgi:hypothetical protein
MMKLILKIVVLVSFTHLICLHAQIVINNQHPGMIWVGVGNKYDDPKNKPLKDLKSKEMYSVPVDRNYFTDILVAVGKKPEAGDMVDRYIIPNKTKEINITVGRLPRSAQIQEIPKSNKFRSAVPGSLVKLKNRPSALAGKNYRIAPTQDVRNNISLNDMIPSKVKYEPQQAALPNPVGTKLPLPLTIPDVQQVKEEELALEKIIEEEEEQMEEPIQKFPGQKPLAHQLEEQKKKLKHIVEENKPLTPSQKAAWDSMSVDNLNDELTRLDKELTRAAFLTNERERREKILQYSTDIDYVKDLINQKGGARVAHEEADDSEWND